MDSWLFLTTFLTLILLPICVYRQLIWEQIKIYLRKKFGLVGIDQICIFYDQQKSKATIHIVGITLEEVASVNKNNKKASNPSNTLNESRMLALKTWIQSSTFIKAAIETTIEISILIIMSLVVNHIAIHIDKLTYFTRKKDDLVLKVDHIYMCSTLNVSKLRSQLFQERMFVIQIQVGPVTVAEQQDDGLKSLVEMTTACLVMVSCQFEAKRIMFKDVDLDIQLGLLGIFLDRCLNYTDRHYKKHVKPDQLQLQQQQNQHLDMSTSKFMHLGNKINSISVTIQKVNLEYHQIAIKMEIDSMQIQAFFKRKMEPSIQFNTELVMFYLQEHRLVNIPSMEITAALPPQDEYGSQHHATIETITSDALPHTDLLSVTWIINTPLLTLPLKSQTFLDTLVQLQQKQQNNTTSTTSINHDLPQKRISNLPACTLAIVFNSARMELLDVDSDKRNGYMSSKSLIVRFSGEYMKKSNSRNSSSFDDVPSSSSSSSASRFDSWFAQEEYKWLSGGGSSSSLTSKNRNSIHESTQQQQQQQGKSATPPPPSPSPSTPTPTAVRWLNLLGRVSRRRQSSPAPSMKPQQRHQKWTYRLSLKIIIQHVNFGYLHQQQIHDFVRVKNTVFILKSGMHVIQNQVVFTPGNIIQSEAAIDKPLIFLWDTHHNYAMSASVFWIKSVPTALSSLRSNSNKSVNIGTENGPDWKQVVAKSISFSLDVTQGSVVALSIDAARSPFTERINAPQGYIDNSPKDTVYTRMILDTQKLTFVCEGPYAIVGQQLNNEWKTRCHVEKLYIHQSSSCLQQNVNISELLEKAEKQHVILWISQLNFTTKHWQAAEKHLSVVIKVKKYGISYSIRNHYACLLLFRSLYAMKNQLKSYSSGLEHQHTTVSTPVLQFSVDLSVGRGDIQIGLPQDTRLYLRMDELDAKYSNIPDQKNIIQFRNIMLLGASPTHHDMWEQLVEIDHVKITMITAIELKSKKMFASVPYKFVLSVVIDNVIGLVKAIKELHARILEKDPFKHVFTYFGPTVNNEPIAIPHIKLRAKVFTIHFDDDPFEAKLRNILRTGLQEQQRRLAYREALDDKIYEMLHSTSTVSPEPASANSSMHQQTIPEDFQSIYTSSSTINAQKGQNENRSNGSTASTDNAEVYVQIAEAQRNLLEHYSEFWMKHINKTVQEEVQFFEALHVRNNYRNSLTAADIDKALDDGDSRRHDRFLLSKTFTIDIVPRPLYPPLANFTAQYAKVSFKPANFMLEETRSFIQMVGSGVPLDNDFSIIIPFHLSIKASRTWIKVRDYPLPLLYVPPPATGRVSWTLEGDYALGDELGNSGGSRIIPITIIPLSTPSEPAGYCLSAVRTASPLKFYSIIDYHVLTQGMSMICWSISYNPAVQDILHVLDNLTAAQVDPSPRIGFWDKVRFMIHSQVKIQFSGGGKLAFAVKGTRDPYQLLERGAGLAKVWSDDVVWLLGYENNQNEFMQIISQNYAFGVPDLIHGGFVPQLPDSLQYKQDKMFADDNHVFLKVALKLSDGVRMGIGLSYERLSCHSEDANNNNLCIRCKYQCPHLIDRCRSQIFMPHYNVLFQSIQQVNTYFDKVK